MNLFSGIQAKAVLMALLTFYVAPLPVLVVLTSIPNFFGFDPTQGHSTMHSPFTLALVWFYALAPMGAAYLAAKRARQQPLLHGLVMGVLGSVLVMLWVQDESVVFDIVIALTAIPCGVLGGWLWRYRNTQPNTLREDHE